MNGNPVNYFAETEQVAFNPSNLVPGIDLTNDPLLQARLFSYLDTQITRLGGPNWNQIPINRAHAPVCQWLIGGRVGRTPGEAAGRQANGAVSSMLILSGSWKEELVAVEDSDLGEVAEVVPHVDLFPHVGGQRQRQVTQTVAADPVAVHRAGSGNHRRRSKFNSSTVSGIRRSSRRRANVGDRSSQEPSVDRCRDRQPISITKPEPEPNKTPIHRTDGRPEWPTRWSIPPAGSTIRTFNDRSAPFRQRWQRLCLSWLGG